ncbi:hypothetical protein ACQEUX_33465 [Micromonospora sp. CA-259024]|uniref:hypothetical protein n=1 Tax=Micromonospora sp. CA-259024 TaxID=3239965 RepID=UPI003D89E884
MTAERLFNLAAEFAEATGNAERFHARAACATGDDRTALTVKASSWKGIAAQRREALRIGLREASRGTVTATPDEELPVALWQRRHVEVRAITLDAAPVRVRYSPAQAVALGTALIAFATLTDQRGGGILGGILATFPPTTNAGNEPRDEDGTRA